MKVLWKWSKKEDEWYRPRAYKEPRDFKPESLLEAIDLKKAVFKAYRDRIIAALDQHAVPAVAKQREFDDLIALDPDDTELRKLLGYVTGWEGRDWVLPESKTSKESAERISASISSDAR